MTGYKSKRDAALDEEGMYLVHHTKRKVDDDDIQVYKRPWVGLTDEEIEKACVPLGAAMLSFTEVARAIEAKLKELNS
jgi:hypothetical protein